MLNYYIRCSIFKIKCIYGKNNKYYQRNYKQLNGSIN